MLSDNSELEEKTWKAALLNAVSHRGKAQQQSVIGKLLGEMPQLKSKIKELKPVVARIVEKVNSLDLEAQRKRVEQNWPEALARKKAHVEKRLPPLPNVDKFKEVVTRFSPNPDAPIHLGSARAIILCSEYAKKYNGKFLVRFEDTDPKLKRPQLPFYASIKQDLKWLKCEPHTYFIQSDRLPIYYRHAEQLLIQGNAYICTCKTEAFKKLLSNKLPCVCRGQPPQEHLKRWKKMLDGTYLEREAVLRVKTDLAHPNPAVRDWPALRIIDTELHPHPRVGKKYRVWPLYNLACGVDDHLMKVTHIIRGKEHLTNQIRQEFMYRHFNWTYPEAIHYGRLKIFGASLSKSKIVQGMREGIYTRWDDPRLATFAALRRRGIQAEAIKRLIVDVGPKTQDVTLSWENLYAHNRKSVDAKANRYFFCNDPKKMEVRGLKKPFEAKIPLHPDYRKRGFRRFNVIPKKGVAKLWISTSDFGRLRKGQNIRFMELFNVKVDKVEEKDAHSTFHSENMEIAKETGAQLIHWLPEETNVPCQVVLPDASITKGLAEAECKELKTNTIVQFSRFGFARIDNVKTNAVVAYYSHC